MATPTDIAGMELSDEERFVLSSAQRDGYVSAKLFAEGDFSEEGFLLFGKLEMMCRKGLLRFVERHGENDRAPGDVKMVFAPAMNVLPA